VRLKNAIKLTFTGTRHRNKKINLGQVWKKGSRHGILASIVPGDFVYLIHLGWTGKNSQQKPLATLFILFFDHAEN